MKVCVLQPDYSTTGVDYKYYDPPRNLSALLPNDEVDHVFLNKLTTYRQLKELKKKNYDVFVNLCEGYLEWEVPSIDVIHSFELLDLPHTGPTAKLYDPTKELMKYVAHCEGVKTPGYFIIEQPEDIDKVEKYLSYPMFIKPAKAGDSLGIDENSVLYNKQDLLKKVVEIFNEYGPLLVEEYIDGREFTVLVAANRDGKSCRVFKPVEYVFPEGKYFKTYSLKTSELHPDCNFPCTDPVLDKKLRAATEKIFKGFNGVGYARLDFRVNDNNEIYFLEINFTCSVFYTDGYEGSADFILRFDEAGQKGFLEHIIEEGIARHRRKKKPYAMKGNSIAGFGIYASRNIRKGDIIFTGEEKAQRIVTRRFVERNWDKEQQLHFRRYAYALSEEVFVLWDEDPSEWAPQNHSCDANTGLDGLNVIALRNISRNEELTLDYSQFLNETMEPFECKCGSVNCKGEIKGVLNNSVTSREQQFLITKER
ncbi:SET domain-containing protein-lysine N-methyltransferase [Terrimonas pollutisoli]|uniref:SET domain-containing protein-lysine N-methyltransferase n=1 Tax=Terrimonas pollutisoli TaxID=3034147 RepID=UPI0023EE2473|nr:SET domain-containing protein-lysine N-methyltransferase [Terrimonas sp. H1YJ31]